MPLNPDIRDRAYQFFIEEASELLQVIEQGLLDLHQDHSISKVHELMRAAHSIKGGAASVELGAIELLAHRLEDFFKALYSDDVELDEELENLLLQGYDCLSHPLNQQIQKGSFDEEAALLAAEPIFTALEDRLKDALDNSDSYIPTSSDLGVDIVASIFEVDVAGAIEHLKALAAKPQHYDLVAQLQEQLDLLAGFAELFNLSGFNDIVETARSAVEVNPQRILDIIRAVIADCSIARERVLAGDRLQGGEVSPTLQKLAQTTASNTSDDRKFDATLENLDESASLWSQLPTEEPLAEAIFKPDAELQPNQSETEPIFADLSESNSLWSQLPAEEPLAETIFEQDAELQPNQSETEPIFADLSESNSLWSQLPVEEPLTEVIEDRTIEENTQSQISDESPATNSLAIEEQSEDTDLVSATETITAAVKSIEKIFDDLPTAELPDRFFSPTEVTSKTPSQPPKTQQKKAARKLFVRVNLERLEKMNNLVGELTINRNSLSLQNLQLQENVTQLERKLLRFGEITRKVRTLSDLMLVEQRRDLYSKSDRRDHHTAEESSQFDPLEMDSYNALNSALQEIFEEIVQLEESVDDINIFAQQSDRTIDEQRQMLDRMRGELMWVRMLPLEQILQRFPRTVRDLSNKYHKSVKLKFTGTDVLVDRAVLEKLSDPLLHLLRNAFDHGIEEPEVRQKQGKPATGIIEIKAYYQGDRTVIEVKDDGRGLDTIKIARQGVERGLISEAEASSATPQQLFNLIFEPGFSTASQVNEVSGRGVGMDIVRSQIETLKGKVSVASTLGEGSVFTLRLPLTLSITKLLICSLGATTFAIASDSIAEIIVPTAKQIKSDRQQKLLSFNRRLIPIYPLKELLQYNCAVPASESDRYFKTVEPPDDWLAPLLLLRRDRQLIALEVDSLLNEQELVIKPYGKAIAAPAYSYGCTILGDGSLIPVFDGSATIATILDKSASLSRLPKPKPNTERELATSIESGSRHGNADLATVLQTIMIVDDSTALRRTMALTLEKQGYRVIQRKDGKDALDGFKQNPDLDLIICDLEMPVMNGLEFLGMRRRDSALSQIPTLMLTSRGGIKHRNLAMQLGADDYFIKPYDESELVAKVTEILSGDRIPIRDFSPAIASNTATILVIDDSSALRRTLALSLKHRGYRVLQARDGAEGLETLRHNLQTDLVICDLEMPNTNGFEFLTMRRQEPKLAEIPVVMLTSRGSDKHRILANSLGAAGFFTKPYAEEQFLQDIAKFIRRPIHE